MNKMFIPERINVGFQERNDTYTGKLAYVIYYDKKGVLRKEKSWNSWRNHKIDSVEYDNKPTSGFVLNKKVGGYKSDWNFRNAYVRIYDPRNFEFEITVENLLFILAQCDCTKGKGLEGEFVYGWSGTDLVLLPVESETYKESLDFSDLQGKKVSAKELILGASYETKSQQKLTYLGRFMHRELYQQYRPRKAKKEYIFWNGKDFCFYSSMSDIARLISSNIHSDYSDLVEKYQKSIYYDEPDHLFLKQGTLKSCKNYTGHVEWMLDNNRFVSVTYNYPYKENSYNYDFDAEPSSSHYSRIYSLENGQIKAEWARGGSRNNPKYSKSSYYADTIGWIKPQYQQLYVKMKSGSEHKIG